jgi:hypothetical protein
MEEEEEGEKRKGGVRKKAKMTEEKEGRRGRQGRERGRKRKGGEKKGRRENIVTPFFNVRSEHAPATAVTPASSRHTALMPACKG